jgi:hypothetical protein
MVTRRLIAECIDRGGELTLTSLILTNSMKSFRENEGLKTMPENKGLTLIVGGKLVSRRAPSALALDTELQTVASLMAKDEPFRDKKVVAKGEDLSVLTAFVKATRQALSGR